MLKSFSIRSIILFFCLTVSFAVIARPHESKSDESKLDTIVAAFQDGKTFIGVSAYMLDKRRFIYRNGDTTLLNPASTMKIVTSVASLKHLGGHYRYATLYSTDKMQQDSIQNLFVKGRGDPSITEDRFHHIARKMKLLGVSRIKGDIVLDKSHFLPDPGLAPGLSRNMMTNAAFVLNPRYTPHEEIPISDDGDVLDLDPPTSPLELYAYRNGLSPRLLPSQQKKALAVRGAPKTPLKKSPKKVPVKIPKAIAADPVLYAGEILKNALIENGIEFKGKVRTGSDQGFIALFEDNSEPLAKIIHEINKKSNNFAAEMVLKTLSAEELGPPGSMQKGALFLENFLSFNGIPREEFHVVNGSGLSRDNRLSANALTRMMIKAYLDPSIRQDFLDSLSVAGVDGTLRRRFKSPDLMQNVIGKTGTLRDTCALSGYLRTKEDRLVAFTILVNNPAGAGARYYELQEKLLQEIYDNY